MDIFSFGYLLLFMLANNKIIERKDFDLVLLELKLKPRMFAWMKLIEQCIDEEAKRPNVDQIIKFIMDWKQT